MASMYDRIQASLAQQRDTGLISCSIPALPSDCLRIQTIDLHTGGEPLRVVVDGFPELPGSTVLERRRYCRDRHDPLRTALMWEPRGHSDMYGALLVPPNDVINTNEHDEGAAADLGLIFIHNEGYSTMCGHAIIAIGTLAVQMQWMADIHEGTNELLLDVPCGRIRAFVDVDRDLVTVKGVRFHCVPSFVVALDRTVVIPRLLGEASETTTKVTYDLAYGGAFYAYVDLAKNPALIENGYLSDDTLSPGSVQQLIDTGMLIKRTVAAADHSIIRHPSTTEDSTNEDLNFLYGTIFVNNQRQQHSGADSRNVCIFAEAEVDRSPTGSGVSGRMALARARGEMDAQSPPRTIESITGSVFRASIVRDFVCEIEAFKSLEYPAVIPQVEGTAFITGQHSFIIDPKDPMRKGFLLR